MKLSVIIPVYNREKYIKDCIESVLNQKNPGCKYEVIVVDDGSTDSTPKVLSKFKDKIKYIRIENSGTPAAPRNVGVKAAKGEIIAFLDSDDLWVENKLSLQCAQFVNSGAALSYGNADIIDEKGKFLNIKILNHEEEYLSGYAFDKLIVNNYVSTLTTMVKKKVLIELGGFNESPDLVGAEDYHMWLRIASKYKITSLEKTLAHYRTHEGNISTHNAMIGLKRVLKMTNNLIEMNGFFNEEQKRLLIIKRKELKRITSPVRNSVIYNKFAKLRNKISRIKKGHSG